ncbi:MAG: hypothetical protein IKF52_05000 [Clostridia bacterium]|nr:hypothetical protein [Clostridia bacterium]
MADKEKRVEDTENQKKLFFIDLYIVKNSDKKNSRLPTTGHKKVSPMMVMATFWDENGLQYSIDIHEYIMEYYHKPFVSEEMVSKFRKDAKSGSLKFRYNEELEILF